MCPFSNLYRLMILGSWTLRCRQLCLSGGWPWSHGLLLGRWQRPLKPCSSPPPLTKCPSGLLHSLSPGGVQGLCGFISPQGCPPGWWHRVGPVALNIPRLLIFMSRHPLESCHWKRDFSGCSLQLPPSPPSFLSCKMTRLGWISSKSLLF